MCVCVCVTPLLPPLPLPSLQELLTQLRTVFDLIVELQLKQETIVSQCLQEMERRNVYEKRKRERTEKVLTYSTCVCTYVHGALLSTCV